jgi:butyryl-CoA dehydrogenase
MAEGRFFGTMCLSEPQAGSALAAIATRAEVQDDGSYRVFGTKMWISAGEHSLSENIVHLVLARTPGAPDGVKGLSLFIVPKFLVGCGGEIGERNDVVLAGLNHKMGYRGTTNTVLSFGDGRHQPGGRAGAVGYLVGEKHEGLAYMFHMMNEARIAVGAGATALGYTGYLKSLAYARTREQGRPIHGRGADREQARIVEHPDVKRMLLAQKSYVEGALALNLYCARLLDVQETASTPGETRQARRLLDILTPIAKSWPSQWCLEANSLAIQIHGGYGYTRDYDLEQHYRDNRLNQIHEGTHGIQALDLLGRKVRTDAGACFHSLVAGMRDTVARADAASREARQLAIALATGIERLAAVTEGLWAQSDPEKALPNASTYLEATGHLVLAWMWLEQFLCADGKRGNFYDGKRQAARYFYSFELPKTQAQFDLLERLDSTVPDTADEWL